MSSRPLYQAAISELESVLAPRVVSRSLKDGLAQIGSTPEDLDLPGLEKILKGPVYRQLQVAMPAQQAKETISEMLGRLRGMANGSVSRTPTPPPLEGQLSALTQLKEAMRPFNLYFEWPEVQKLRAQIQLLEREQHEGREAGGLVRDAREQLRTVAQKLEDQLVIQARELGELEDMVAGVRSLGGPKVRRLENILGQIAAAQEERQLAAAEIERARKLGSELRKLLESSVLTRREEPLQETVILEVEPDEEELTLVQDDLQQDVNARLLQIDLDSERHDLASLESARSHLLEHVPQLRERFDELKASLTGGVPVGDRLSELRTELDRAATELQERLREELDSVADDALRYRHQVDTGELGQSIQIARGVLDTGLPTLHDLRRIRDLHAHVVRSAGEAERLEAAAEDERQSRLQEQGAALERMKASLERFRNEPGLAPHLESLQDGLTALQVAHEQNELVPELLAVVRKSEERLQAAAHQGRPGESGVAARARALLAEVESLPSLPFARERLRSLGERLAALADPEETRDQEGEALAEALRECEVLVRALRLELHDGYGERLVAAREEADRLAEPYILGLVEQAEAQLAEGEFPSLHEIEGNLRAAADRKRQEQLSELRSLELEAGRFAGLGLPGYEELRELVERGSLESDVEPLLGRAWLQLEAIRATVEQRLEGVESRLDAALQQLAAVEKLNSEDVEEARRILRHLDDQRGSLGRVSLGLRLELESSLQRAEKLLDKLEQEFEATRAIANQLVSGNFIDDMLGLLGGTGTRPAAEREGAGNGPSPAAILAQETAPTTARSDDPKLNEWVDGYLAEEGVHDLLLLDESGRLVCGRNSLPLEATDARTASDELMRLLTSLGAELGRGAPTLATVEVGSRSLVISRPLGGYRLVALVESAPALSNVLHRLRRELARGI